MSATILKTILNERKITPYRLAKECNIASSDIYQILNGKKPLFPKWRKAIAEFLEIDETLLFERGEEDTKNVIN